MSEGLIIKTMLVGRGVLFMGVFAYKQSAESMIKAWKGGNYHFGYNAISRVGEFSDRERGPAVVVVPGWGSGKKLGFFVDEVMMSLKKAGFEVLDTVKGARPNAPREDVYRIAYQISKYGARYVVAVGGGSTIDATKAAIVLSSLPSDNIEDYFGVGKVAEKVKAMEGEMRFPTMLAIQTAAGSAAHLTKYANVTDPLSNQKKLIIDDTIVPPYAIFDYRTLLEAPSELLLDGALDGVSHCLEVAIGAVDKPFFEKVMDIAEVGISLIVDALSKITKDAEDKSAIEELCLGTDLGGYSIMVGGTNYAHLFSFSLVGKLSHGRACAIVNPYALVFFAPAIEKPLRMLGEIFHKIGYIKADIDSLYGKELGMTVASGMLDFLRDIGYPVTLGDVGVDENDKARILSAAKDTQLWSKLDQAPISLIARGVNGQVDPG